MPLRHRRVILLAHALLAGSTVTMPGWGDVNQPSAEPAKQITVDDRIKAEARRAPLAMTFQGKSAQECREWQEAFRDKLGALLGPHRPPAKWRVVVERDVELKDYRRQELLLVADGHPPLPMYLLTPHPPKGGRMPGIVALHGHGSHGHDPVAGRDDLPGVAEAIKSANYDYGRQLVREGFVVAVPCLTPFGRRLGDRAAYGKQDPCAVTFVRLQLLGKVLMAENLRDSLWALEFLARDERVDAQRLGCVGLSYGGRMTMLTAAVEPRVRVAVISGALNVMQERVESRYSCGAQVIPGLLKVGDVPEIGSLIAPRAAVWEVGTRDSLISPKWAELVLERMGRAYRAFDKATQLHVDRFDGGHRWHGVRALQVLKEELK